MTLFTTSVLLDVCLLYYLCACHGRQGFYYCADLCTVIDRYNFNFVTEVSLRLSPCRSTEETAAAYFIRLSGASPQTFSPLLSPHEREVGPLAEPRVSACGDL